MKMFRYLLLSLLLFSGLFAQNTAYDQVLENDSWKDKVKVRLVENNDTTYSTSPNLADGAGNPISSSANALYTHDFLLLVAEGKIPGYRIVQKFGKNPAVGTSGFDTIWNGGGEYTGFNATEAEIVTITSDDADDNSTGLGLRTIRIYGLDDNGTEQFEDIELDGLNDVNSTKEYLRLDRAKGLTSGGGTFGANLGNVTIKQSITTANVFAVIPIGYNSTMIAAYTIPAGKKGYIMTQASVIANKQAAAVAVRLKAKIPGNLFTVNGEAALNSQGTGFIERKFTAPGQLPPMTDIYIEAEASATVAVAAFIDILLVDIEE